MAEYIEREAFLEHMKRTSRYFDVKFDIEEFPAANVVPKKLYDQAVLERDLAIQQLREDYGVGLGEKKKDVAPVRHGRWEFLKKVGVTNKYKCSLCGRIEFINESTFYNSKEKMTELYPYCHCGAKMEGGAENG